MKNLIEPIDKISRDTKMSTEGTSTAGQILETFLASPFQSCRVKTEDTNFTPDEMYRFLISTRRRKGIRGKVVLHRNGDLIYLEKEKVRGLR